MMSGKDAFLALLKQEGVEYIFGNPGTTELPLMEALAREKEIRYISSLMEAAVIPMADGYAQASGKLGVVNLHCAPGLGNAMGMLYDAYRAGTPLLVTAGQQDQSMTIMEPSIWSDLVSVARPWVKWSFEVRRLDELPLAIHRAAKAALTPPMGPVFLSLPMDLFDAEAELDLGAPTRIDPRQPGARDAVEQAATRLIEAREPIFVVGDTVAESEASTELVQLAELLGAPIYLEVVASRCAVPFAHPLYQGVIPRIARQARRVIEGHDLLFSVGAELFTFLIPSEEAALPEGIQIVQVDSDPWEIGKNYPAQVGLQGDPKTILTQVIEAVRRRLGGKPHGEATARRSLWAQRREKRVSEMRAYAEQTADRTPMAPLGLVNALAKELPSDVVIVDEALSSGLGVRHLLPCRDTRSFFSAKGLGIGWALPAAVGIKLASPNRPVVALVGDGSSMYSFQALWTAAHRRIGVVIVILNNQGYRLLKDRLPEPDSESSDIGMNLTDPTIDHLSLARGLGISGERIQTAGEVGPALERAFRSGKPYVIDAMLDSRAGLTPPRSVSAAAPGER